MPETPKKAERGGGHARHAAKSAAGDVPGTGGTGDTGGPVGRGGRHRARHAAAGRRTTPTLLVGVAVVAMGGVAFLALGRSGLDRAGPPPGPAPVTSPTVRGELIAPGDVAPSPSGPPAFELSEARDPFRPLVVPAPEGPAGAVGAPPGSTTDTGASPSPSASPGSGAAEAAAPQGGEEVELLDVVDDQGTTKAQVKVGSTVSTVAVGETFASTYTLVSIQGTCATMRNAADVFTLCTGDQVLK